MFARQPKALCLRAGRLTNDHMGFRGPLIAMAASVATTCSFQKRAEQAVDLCGHGRPRVIQNFISGKKPASETIRAVCCFLVLGKEAPGSAIDAWLAALGPCPPCAISGHAPRKSYEKDGARCQREIVGRDARMRWEKSAAPSAARAASLIRERRRNSSNGSVVSIRPER
jgi:hypothetical protein